MTASQQVQVAKDRPIPIGPGRSVSFWIAGHCVTGQRWCVFVLLLFWICSRTAPSQTGPSEYQVKAAYLLNFTKFVEWPLNAFESPDSPLTICVLGDDPFGAVLDQLIQEEIVNGRRLAVERLRRLPKPKTCQVLFVSASEKDVGDLLAGVGPGVLTVGDREAFLKDGGMIAFVLEGRNVRFDVQQAVASKELLAISARLLKVARTVHK